jgi:virulence-associated protein VagC
MPDQSVTDGVAELICRIRHAVRLPIEEFALGASRRQVTRLGARLGYYPCETPLTETT